MEFFKNYLARRLTQMDADFLLISQNHWILTRTVLTHPCVRSISTSVCVRGRNDGQIPNRNLFLDRIYRINRITSETVKKAMGKRDSVDLTLLLIIDL